MAEYLISELQVPGVGDPVMIIKDKEARDDLSTALATVTGNPLNFSTRSAQKAVETVISLEPIQDLHGYDHPWPAGGGKNKFDYDTTYSDFKQSDGTFRGVANVVYLAKYRILSELVGSQLTFSAFLDLTDSGTLTWVRCRANVSGSWVNGSKVENGTSQYSSVTFTPTSTDDYVVLEYGSSGSNLYTFSEIQLEVGALRTSFTPYSNICPIDGRTETSLVGTGSNMFGGEVFAQKIVDNVQGSSIDRTNKTVYYSASNVTGVVLYEQFKPNTQYTFYFPSDGYTNLGIYYTDGTNENVKNSEVTISQRGKTVELLRGKWFTGATTVYYEYCGIMEGEHSVSDFTSDPYHESNNLTIQFGEKVYGATLTMETGELVIDRVIVDLGDLSWSYNTYYSNGYFYASVNNGKIVENGQTNAKCSCYPVFNGAFGSFRNNNDNVIYVCPSSVTNSPVCVRATAYSDDTSAFTTAMSGQQLVYELATPITIHLTPNKISLLEGVNNILTDGDTITLTYRDGKVATISDLESTAETLEELIEDVAETIPIVYSDTERAVGTWFGETLYQKSYELTTALLLHSNSWTDTDISSTGIEKIIKCEGCSDGIANAGLLASANTNTDKIQLLNLRTSDVNIQYFTLWYTKTE